MRRRRECETCSHRFTTFERRAPSLAIVLKRDGRREEFNPEKLRAGLERAAHKLPAAEAAVPTMAAPVPRAAWLAAIRNVKRAVSIPVMASNRINTPEVAEEIELSVELGVRRGRRERSRSPARRFQAGSQVRAAVLGHVF